MGADVSLHEAINDFVRDAEDSFYMETSEPCSLTIKRNGAYSKKAYVGGEKFLLKGAYLGKRDGTILVFQDLGEPTREVEVPLKRALNLLNGFSAFSEALSIYRDEKVMNVARQEADKKEQEEYARAVGARHKDNAVFGSW